MVLPSIETPARFSEHWGAKSQITCRQRGSVGGWFALHLALPEVWRTSCVIVTQLTDLRGADSLVTATRDSISKQEPDEYGRVSRRWDFKEVCFDVCVSKQNSHRSHWRSRH
jgi:hypothetical protein